MRKVIGGYLITVYRDETFPKVRLLLTDSLEGRSAAQVKTAIIYAISAIIKSIILHVIANRVVLCYSMY